MTMWHKIYSTCLGAGIIAGGLNTVTTSIAGQVMFGVALVLILVPFHVPTK